MKEVRCTDQRLGEYLFAYELGALSQEKEREFEVHLMECDFCLNEVKALLPHSRLLREDDETRKAICKMLAESQGCSSPVDGFFRRLWPRGPLLLRPAIPYILVLLLIVPAYFGWRGKYDREEIRPVQTINLMSTRSLHPNSLSIGAGHDGVIVFSVPNAAPDHVYQVSILTEGERKLVHTETFAGFDDLGLGRLLVPLARMKAGAYRLIVVDSVTGATQVAYEFRIAP